MPHVEEMVTVAGAQIRLLRGGRAGAPPLVFLHGAGGHTGWMAFLDELARDFAVYAPEHPGFGRSDDPPWLDEIGDLAYFYLDFLETLGLDRVHLVGTSFGGWIAAELAVRNQARLASLTLVGAVGITAGGKPIDDIFRLSIEENLRQAGSAVAKANGTVPSRDNTAPAPEIARAPKRSLNRPMMGRPQKMPRPRGNSIRPVAVGVASRTCRAPVCAVAGYTANGQAWRLNSCMKAAI